MTAKTASSISRVVDLDEAARRRRRWRHQGQTVVLTNGCFDLLHVGHVRYLEQARSFGRLIVGLNSDEAVRQLKGPNRPLVVADERAEVLAALRCVDLVTIFDELTAEALLMWLRPDVYVKGGDYGPNAKFLPEADVARQVGARVELIQFVEGRSTTALIYSIREAAR